MTTLNDRWAHAARKGVAVALLVCAACVIGPANRARAEEGLPRVVVVGAGVSGLASARALASAGFPVTVLEARSRIGGRMWSHALSDGTVLDLGASWIHGSHPQLDTLVADLGFDTVNTRYTNMRIHDSGGGVTAIDDGIVADLGFRFGDALLWNMFWAPNLRIQSMVDIMWMTSNLTGYSHEFVQFFTTMFFETEFAASAELIPVKAFWEWIPPLEEPGAWAALFEPVGDKNTAFPQGYNQLTDHLAAGLDIRLGTTVQHIDYSDSTAVVTTNDGQFEAEVVIVTVPIGVLKAEAIDFSPSLPYRKRAAIARMGSGLLNKLYLRFPHQFWEADTDMLGISRPDKGGFAVWANMEPVTGEPFLMAFSSGQSAIDMEALPDADIVALAMDRLRGAYGDDIPEPTEHVITRWNADPFARGAYSTFGMGTRLGDRAILREPVAGGRLLFAGEATVDFAFSQVPGAYASGLREAERIIDTYLP